LNFNQLNFNQYSKKSSKITYFIPIFKFVGKEIGIDLFIICYFRHSHLQNWVTFNFFYQNQKEQVYD